MLWPTIAIAAIGALIILQVTGARRLRVLKRKAARREKRVSELEAKHDDDLARERAQQAALFDSMEEGFLLLNRDGKIVLVNQALERLFSLMSDIRGQTVMEAFRVPQLQDLVSKAIIEGKVLGAELELPVLEKRVIQVNATLVLNAGDGAQNGMILVFHDLTRIKELENTRTDFVANVSHELRTPLTMIKGYAETLLEGAMNEPEVQSKFLNTIQKHADRLTVLIEDLLTISRMESGQVTLNKQPLEFAKVVDRVIEDLADKASKMNVRFVNESPAELRVMADDDRLQQVLLNLMDNAIKYGGADSEVKIGGSLGTGRFAELQVRDSGPGIPDDSKERIFERFYRIDRARSREQGGTGLGLSIVKHIVQSHGGEVWVESESGQGSAFHFTLPVEPEGQAALRF